MAKKPRLIAWPPAAVSRRLNDNRYFRRLLTAYCLPPTARCPPSMHIQEINSPRELEGLHSVWADLLAATPGATFFQTLPWLQTYWEFFANREAAHDTSNLGGSARPISLRVLVVEAEREAIGILPLVVSIEPSRVGSLRVLGYPLAGWGSFYGPIGPHPEATLAAGLEHIRQTKRDWDLLDLRWVDAEGIDAGQTARAMQAAGFPFETQLWHTSAQVEIHEGWEKYWASRKSTWRSNVRRCERLLSKQGTLEYVRYRPKGEADGDDDPRWDLYDTCVELARRSWQGASTDGTTLSHPEVRDYLRAVHQQAARLGAVDVNLLLLDGQPVAYSYNYQYRGWVYGIRNGYDPAAVQDGAGTVLLGKMIEDSCRRGDHVIDLGPNYLQCKRYWLTRLQPAYHYTHFHPVRLRAQALRMKRIVRRWLGWSPSISSAAAINT